MKLTCIVFFSVVSLVVTAQSDTLTIIGVGDMMMGNNYRELDLPPNDGANLMAEVDSILNSADVTFGNLEGTLMDGNASAKSCKDTTVCYVFRTPTRYTKNLVKAGFDVMSIANNHAGDFGDIGRNSTMRALDSAGILYAGQLPKPTVSFEKNGVKYGLVAFSPNNNCVSVNDTAQAVALVRALDSVCDVVIVSFHGGAEGASYQHVPKKHELFYGEDRGNVYEFAHTVIDAGADVVFGHGPHVSRAVEVYKNRFIAYSLGNFCTYGGMNVKGVNGLAPIAKVYTTRTGEMIKTELIPTYQISHTYVHLDTTDKQVIKVIQQLTKTDFPNADWEISEDGIVTKKSN